MTKICNMPKCDNKRANKKFFCEYHKDLKNSKLRQLGAVGIAVGLGLLTVVGGLAQGDSNSED